MTIRVLVADDQSVVRAGLWTLLGGQPDMDVVGQAADGREAVALARRLRPDVCLFDIRMPVLDGIEAARLLAGPDVEDPIAVVVITTFNTDEYVHGALRAGARGFLHKGRHPNSCSRPCARRTTATPSSTRVSPPGCSPASPNPPHARPNRSTPSRAGGGRPAPARPRTDERRDRRGAVRQPEHGEFHVAGLLTKVGSGTASSWRRGPTRRGGWGRAASHGGLVGDLLVGLVDAHEVLREFDVASGNVSADVELGDLAFVPGQRRRVRSERRS